MASPPLQVEDQTDEDFFDKLVDDDYRVGEYGKGLVDGDDSDELKAFSNLSIGEVGGNLEDSGGGSVVTAAGQKNSGDEAGSSSDAALEKNELAAGETVSLVSSDSLTLNGVIESVDGTTGADIASDSTTSKSSGSASAGVKEVQWSSFSTDSAQRDSGGFGSFSDLFNGLGDNSIDPFAQFRCVCKGWREIAKDPLLKTMRLQFILHCDCPIQNQLYYLEFDSINNGFSKAVAKIPIPLPPKLGLNVLGSCNGLLCLSDSRSAMYICNPFTGDYRELPEIGHYIYGGGVAFGFGFLAKTKEYKVIRIEDYVERIEGRNHIKSECHVLTVGEGGWRTIRDAEVCRDMVASEALVSGKLHWLIRRQRPWSIVSFELEYERFKRVQPPPVSVYEREYSLVVLRDCLSAVCRRNCQVEVWVMKDYDVEESWIKEFVIGQHIPAGLCASSGVNKKLVNAGPLRVICLLQNSKILLEYKKMFLVLYDAEKKEFEDLTIEGLPQWFRTVVHMGSLVSISEALS